MEFFERTMNDSILQISIRAYDFNEKLEGYDFR